MTTQAGQVRQIASAAGIVGVATLLSRVLGFVRDMAIAWRFGAGMQADAFFVAFRIPNTLRELLGEGALSAAFIPTFARTATRESRQAAWDLVSVVMGTLLVVLAVVTLLGVLLAPVVVWVQAPGFAAIPGKLPLTVQLLRIMFPYIFLIGLAALFMAILNSLGHFLTPALSPTVLNIAMIVAVLWLAPGATTPTLPLALAVLVGGVGQLLLQVPAAVSRGWRLRLRLAPGDPRIHAMARLMAPGVGGLAITQINVFVGMFLASFLTQGSVSALTFAFRLVQFPIGVVGVAIGTGALPVMASCFAKDALEEMKGALQGSLRLAFFLSLPAMVGLMVFRLPILHVLFERGAFTRPMTVLTADILLAYSLGLVFYVCNRILAPAFYAMQDTWTPMKVGVLAVGVNITASILLMRGFGAAGLAAATALASLSNFVLLYTALRNRIGRLGVKGVGWPAGKVGVACLPMMGWGLVSQAWWDVLAASGPLAKAALLSGQLAVGAALFAGTAAALRCEEIQWTLDVLRRRASGAPGSDAAP